MTQLDTHLQVRSRWPVPHAALDLEALEGQA